MNPRARLPKALVEELKKDAESYKVKYGAYVRAILLHRKLMDMSNPEFVKTLFNRK
jgi:hypothetical protein